MAAALCVKSQNVNRNIGTEFNCYKNRAVSFNVHLYSFSYMPQNSIFQETFEQPDN